MTIWNSKQLTARSWPLLEKLPVAQSRISHIFYGNQSFITVFTTALHWSLSSARSIHFIQPHNEHQICTRNTTPGERHTQRGTQGTQHQGRGTHKGAHKEHTIRGQEHTKGHTRNALPLHNVRIWKPGSHSSRWSQSWIFSRVVSVSPAALNTVWKSSCSNPSCF
jgi:hypothetical protein